MMKLRFLLLMCLIVFISCTQTTQSQDKFKKITKTIHVYVALCDNASQGIVPVPSKIGDGSDPFNNLYWGCGYGVKTFFKRSSNWELIKTFKNPETHILERCVFKSKKDSTYLVADAWEGSKIKNCINDFVKSSSGQNKDTIKIDNLEISIGGNSELLAYVGHDGLMEFNLDKKYKAADTIQREVIILACISKSYFFDDIKASGAKPLVWTTGLMAPEAYTLEAAIDGWIENETDAQIRLRAAKAYNKYQKHGLEACKNLLVTGW